LIEEISANAWRPAVLQDLSGWQMGYSGGSSRRVNSVLTHQMIGPAFLEERLTQVEDFYRRRDQRVIFKISPATLPTNLPEKLARRGFTVDAETNIQTTTIGALITSCPPTREEILSSPACDDRWFETYTSASGYPAESLPIRRGILSRIGPQANFALVQQNGIPAAVGLGVYERGWLGIYCMVTRAEARRQGYAGQVMRALAEWGEALGTEHVYLQVMENNPPALELYAKLSFKKLYGYYYLIKDVAEQD
jgi:GNAT superfamily N-acetyltransferase